MNDRECRDFEAGLAADVDAWLRGEPTRREFIKKFAQATGMIADNYLQLRTELETALGKLLRLSSEMRRDPATLDILHGLLTDVREPLLFVVVFPLSVVVAGVTIVGLFLCLVLSLPAIWQGASITRALAQTFAIVKSRLLEAVLLLLFVGIHNAWDSALYIALQRRQRPEGTGEQN